MYPIGGIAPQQIKLQCGRPVFSCLADCLAENRSPQLVIWAVMNARLNMAFSAVVMSGRVRGVEELGRGAVLETGRNILDVVVG
jgi:hypothetical protein